MTTGAAEGRDEIPGASPEGSGRKLRENGTGAANVTGRKEQPYPEAATGLMEKIVSRANMMAAYSRVVRNKGAAGVDGMPVTDLKGYLKENWPRIREELLGGKYRPQPVRKVEIPKPGGGTRMLGIPTVLDRLIQQAVHQVLSPKFDPGFSEPYSLEAVEAVLYPSKEPDAAGVIEGDRMGIRHKRPRPLVECRSRAHAQSSSVILLRQNGTGFAYGPIPPTSTCIMNRRVRNRTHGGVGGRRG